MKIKQKKKDWIFLEEGIILETIIVIFIVENRR